MFSMDKASLQLLMSYFLKYCLLLLTLQVKLQKLVRKSGPTGLGCKSADTRVDLICCVAFRNSWNISVLLVLTHSWNFPFLVLLLPQFDTGLDQTINAQLMGSK